MSLKVLLEELRQRKESDDRGCQIADHREIGSLHRR